ncbi:mu-type opioid receptor-like [Strongylocentrotus purpuratus]|uniref:G-protein coupled receptors family 1 profile domain-containing protein n=1 Tax=Strongylocentrotus purpuratus TaxID=7668 RepID=A0A7M7THD3_STRPU|nr:mu-type opioid receptor-like [Strongylocentrotus purpuratus]
METSPGTPTDASVVTFYHRAIVASMFVLLSMIGLFGNGLVIVSVIITKKLRTITNILVVNLAFADFLFCSCLPFLSVGLLSQTGRYPLPEIICATAAGVGYTAVRCSAMTLVIISIVRWYVITRSVRGHRGIHTPKRIATIAVIIWIEAVAFMVVPPLLGIGTLGYSRYYGMCSLKDTNPLTFYYSVLQGTSIVIALMLILTFYGLILRHVLLHNKQFRNKFATDRDTVSTSTEGLQSKTASATSGSNIPMIKAINQKEIDITKNLFIVICVFMFCFLASSVNFIMPGDSVSTLYTTTILMANSVVNPIIYGLKHPNFQEVFKRILCCRRELPKPVLS